MKASVQYNDFLGTTAADRCDLFVESPGEMTSTIVRLFNIPIKPQDYDFIGVSVFGTKANDMCSYFFFKNPHTHKILKYFKESVPIQAILDLFKRFEFQVGDNLNKIDEDDIDEIMDN